jgi:APA family basic amino acid/polyamine antiporter
MGKQLRFGGAVAIGLASMVGAGLFVVFREAYAITPAGFFLALAIAALIAALNAASIYSLASENDRAGGVYSYARRYLSPSISFTAGLAFTLGKIGSVAAIALVFAEYVAQGSRPVAVASIAVMTAINLLGINRTALTAGLIAGASLIFLAVVFTSGFILPDYENQPHRQYLLEGNLDAWNVLQAASVFFFAFAGYARVATLGNEVRDAKRNIPRAVALTLAIVTVLYFALAWQLERVFGQDLHALEQPIFKLAFAARPDFPQWLAVSVFALASLGSMLALLAGVARTAATMAEDGELPKRLSRRNRFGSPLVAQLTIATTASALVFLPDLTWVVGFSSFCVLLYYAIGHLAAMRQARQNKLVTITGMLLCVILAICVPGPAVLAGTALLVLALSFKRVSRAL